MGNENKPTTPSPNAVVDVEYEEDEDRYSPSHISAVLRPVLITMALACLVVANVRDPHEDAALSSGLSMYLIYADDGGEGNTGTAIGQAAINAIVIVAVICGATFVMVLCYYFRLIKVLMAYLIFASTNLLGYSGGYLIYTAIQFYKVTFDWPTLVFLVYNFAVVGVVAIFWQKGTPAYITQYYLIAVSVIMAWILTKLPEWTSWALLVFLALYDLCAVLTPCGPLKLLINLVSTNRDPLPGLVYEVNVEDRDPLDNRVRNSLVTNTGTTHRREGAPKPEMPAIASNSKESSRTPSPAVLSSQPVFSPTAEELDGVVSTTINPSHFRVAPSSSGVGIMGERLSSPTNEPSSETPVIFPTHSSTISSPAVISASSATSSIARSELTSRHSRTSTQPGGLSSASEGISMGVHAPPSIGVPLGEVEAAHHTNDLDQQDEEEEEVSGNIKLGLGDFVFYSVLVSRAALYDMSTLAACYVSVIMGLGGTLFLLSVYKKALPALPISIALGVLFYFVTRYSITPFITEVGTKW